MKTARPERSSEGPDPDPPVRPGQPRHHRDTQLAAVRASAELSVWALSFELTDRQTIPFLMAIVRDGTAVSQVGFTPVGGITMSRDDFAALSRRVLERLDTLRARG